MHESRNHSCLSPSLVTNLLYVGYAVFAIIVLASMKMDYCFMAFDIHFVYHLTPFISKGRCTYAHTCTYAHACYVNGIYSYTGV